MDILAAIKREERKLEKQLHKLNHQLSGVRAAAKALGGSAEREVVGVSRVVQNSQDLVCFRLCLPAQTVDATLV